MEITIGKKFSESVEAVKENKSVQQGTSKSGAFEKKEELIGERGLNRKVFGGNQGKRVAEFYDKPLFYKAANNKIDEIDNTLVVSGDSWETKANFFKTRFNRHPSDGRILNLEQHGCKATLISRDIAAKCDCGAEACDCKESAKNASRIMFKSVKGNADLEYIASADRVKENIVINEKADDYVYDFEIEVDGMYFDVASNGRRLELKNKETGTVRYYIPAPFMTDARGAFSESVYYEITQITPEKMGLKVIADKDWINAERREFPVTVDPQIVVNSFEGSGSYDYSYTGYSPEIFRYETLHNGLVVAEALFISHSNTYYDPSCIYESNLIINKSGVFPYLQEGSDMSKINRVLLGFTVERRGIHGDFNVDRNWAQSGYGEFEVDITDKFKNGSGEIVIEFKEQTNRNGGYEKYIFISNPVLKVEYVYEASHITIAQAPYRTVYRAGDRFDPSGMKVKVHYTNGGDKFITDYSYSPSGPLSFGKDKITVTYKEDNITYTAETNITVKPQALGGDASNYVGSSISSDVETDPARCEKIFSAAGGARVLVNLATGDSKAVFADCGTEDSVISAEIAHVYKNGSYTSKGCGSGFMLSINDRLTRDADGNYIYTDGLGRTHTCEDTYYYINNNNKKSTVAKSNVTVQPDGKLMCGGYEVFRETCDDTGLTFGGEYKGVFGNLKYFDGRSDERKQLEEQIDAYKKTFDQYVIANNDFNVVRELKNNYDTDNKFAQFISYVSDYPYLITENEILNVKSMEFQRDSLDISRAEVSKQRSDLPENPEIFLEQLLERQFNSLTNQIELIEDQLQFIADKKSETTDSLEKYYTAYRSALKQLELLKRNQPVNYASDGNVIKAFNESGDMVALVDAYENIVTLERDSNGRLTGVYSGEEKEIDLSYLANGKLSEMTDGRGRKIRYVYDSSKLSEIEYADGTKITLTYDRYNLAKIAHSDGEITQLLYDNSGRLTEVESYVDGQFVDACKIEYAENKTTAVSPNGEEIYEYADGKLSGYTEIADGRVVQAEKYSYVERSNKHIERAKADSLNRNGLGEFSYVKGESTDIELDGFNMPTCRTETGLKNGDGIVKRVTKYVYDADRHCVRTETNYYKTTSTVLYTAVTTQAYNAQGRVARTESWIDGEENTEGVSVTEYVYDDKGREIKRLDYNSLDVGSKFCTERSYDDIGRETAVRGQTGELALEYEYYDGTRSVRSEKYPNGGRVSYGKDVNDRVTAITQSTENGEENSTLTRYDRGRPVRVESGNTVAEYAYDNRGRVTCIKLNGADYVRYQYTEDQLQTDGSVTDKTKATNAKNETFESKTDKSGNVLAVNYNGAEQWNATYGKNGNVTLLKDKISGETVTSAYDSSGRPITYTVKNGSETYGESVKYNADGKATEIETNGRKYVMSYKSNAEKTLSGISTGGFTFRQQTDKLGRYTGRSVECESGEIAKEKIAYRKVGDRATNMPCRVEYNGGRITYVYDDNGNIREIRENGELTSRYKYDSLNRLIREDNKTLGKTETTEYDNNGNILEKRIYAFTLQVNLDELEKEVKRYAYNGDRLTNYDGQEYGYDAIGNPTKYRGKSVTWAKGRNMTAYDGVKFTYDGRGRRISKGSISYTYSSSGEIVKESNGAEYIYGGSGVAGIVYGDETYFYRKDVQGNIIGVIDRYGTDVVKYMYDAWGNHTVKSPSGEEITDISHIGHVNPFRYRGYYYDRETGLYYLNSRYYDPETGRFINADDISYLDSESINGLNLYAYCLNNPIIYTDPTGCSPIPWWGKILIGIGAVLVGAAVAALTAGTGVGFMAAFGAALLTSTKAVAISTAISTGIGLAVGGITTGTWEGALDGMLNGAVDGFMWGGIFAGGAQILSGGFSGLAKLGVTTGRKGGILKSGWFSPNKMKGKTFWDSLKSKGQVLRDYGGTIMKFGNYAHIDVSTKSLLHLHFWFTRAHLPLGTILAGIIGGF